MADFEDPTSNELETSIFPLPEDDILNSNDLLAFSPEAEETPFDFLLEDDTAYPNDLAYNPELETSSLENNFFFDYNNPISEFDVGTTDEIFLGAGETSDFEAFSPYSVVDEGIIANEFQIS